MGLQVKSYSQEDACPHCSLLHAIYILPGHPSRFAVFLRAMESSGCIYAELLGMLPAAGKSHMDRGPLFPGTWGISVFQSILDNIEQKNLENSAVRIREMTCKKLINIDLPTLQQGHAFRCLLTIVTSPYLACTKSVELFLVFSE